MSDFDFIDYDKISNKSDAFLTSDELNSYFQYIPSTKATSYNIRKELHTAGTTENPEDYKVPDVSLKILPRKLYRINAFHSNYSENLELNKVNVDPDIIYPTKVKEFKEKKIDYSALGLNQDQIEFMMALQNLKSLRVDESTKELNIEQFQSVEEKVANGFFQLYPRYMEMLTTGYSSGGLNQFYDETETSSSVDESQAMINDSLKKLGLNPSEVRVKKKFEVRSGNAKKDEVNAYLQDISLSNNVSNNTRSINNNSVTNINEINLQNNNKIDLQVRSSRTVNNINNSNKTDFNFVNNTNKTVNELVTNVSKFSEATKIDFDNLYKAFLKDLNIAPNVENQFFKIINQHSKNLSIEFNRILNHSEKTVYETNLKNLSTSYNFYRHIENRYREFIQNLNFFNETVQQIKQTEINLKNTYQNIHRHSVTHKNNHYKNIVNLTKNVNYEYTANDYEFQYAVLKTIKNSNQYVENKITKIKNDLNVAQQNISFVHHRMVHIQEKTSNFVAKEIKNVLNNTDYIDEYSNIIVNKISNISNNQTVRALLSLVTNEEQLNSIYTVLRQSNINTSNIKNLVDVINYSKNNNFEITKVSSSTVENIKNLVSLSKNIVDFNNTENKIFQNVDKNIVNKLSSINVEEFKSFVNLSESKSFFNVAKSISNVANQDIKNLLSISLDAKNINNLYSLSKHSNIDFNQIENLYKTINFSKNNNFDITKLSGSTIENIKNLVNLSNLQSIAKVDFNVLNKLSSTNINEEIKSFVNLSESKSFTRIAQSYKNISNIFENLNTTSFNPKYSSIYLDQKNVENLNIVKNLKNVQQIKELSQNVNQTKNTYILEKLSNFNTENITEKINLLKNINITQDVKKTDNIVRKITRLARYNNVKQISENIDEITSLESNISTTQFKTEVQNLKNLINLTKNVDQVNVDNINKIDISKLNNIKVSQFNLLVDNINQLSKISQVRNLTEEHLNVLKQMSQLQNVNQFTIRKVSELKNVNQETILAINQVQNIGQENIYKIRQIKNVDQNTIQAINQIQNVSDQQINLIKSVNQVSNIQNVANLINLTNKSDISNIKLSSINQITEVAQKISKIENKDLLNVVNLSKVVQERKIYNRISNLVKNVEVLDTVNVTQETAQNISKISNTNNINQITKDLNLISQNYQEFKTSVQQIKNIAQVRNVDQIVKNLNYVNNVIQENNIVNRVSKIDQKEFITAINLSKNYIQSFNRFESKISNISQRQKIRETLQDINIVNNEVNNSTVQITNKTQKVQLQEFVQNLNLLETEKNTTILNRYSFESNKKNISNLFTELNLTQQIKQEKRTEKEFARISKRLDRMNKETIKVQGNSYKVEQNFFDMMNFYNEQKVSKTSKDRKVNNFFQLLDVLNVQKTTNERKVTQKIQKIEQVQNRIVNNTSQIKIDVYREKKDNYYKVDNRQTFTTNNYHQEKEEQKKTEKIVENKVEELLVKKIENVTNNLVSNTITKNEFNTIKKEIIQEIYNIEMKTEERIKELRKETQQTVQTMLERFLRS